MRGISLLLPLFLIMALILPGAALAGEINWNKAGASKISLFYPGVTSWEFLTSDDHRLGGREIKQGKKDCKHCHLSKEGELDLKADEIASGTVKMKRSHNPFEPEPLPGKKGLITAKVQAAYDNDYMYIRIEWDSKGAGWQKKASKGLPDRVSLQINKSEVAFKKYGCFITCHNDLSTMPNSPSRKEVVSNGYYGSQNRDDVRLYAYYARTSWSERKPQGELDKRIKDGGRIDLVSAEINNGEVAAHDGWIMDDRKWEDKTSVEASGSYGDGRYAAVIRTKLKSTDKFDIQAEDGDVISVGMAIHEDGVEKRKHYVSFPFTVGLGANADVRAEKISR
ncbi:MAG: hypothetical protein HY954_06095 [Deltaproteobacteria bacterium]|nr:hypothetical protein [Deltaproteobacteria bacterium]